jgi:hypothetical protein
MSQQVRFSIDGHTLDMCPNNKYVTPIENRTWWYFISSKYPNVAESELKDHGFDVNNKPETFSYICNKCHKIMAY